MTFTIYVLLIIITSIVGLVLTYRIGQQQRREYDTDTSERIEAHPYTLNPVFLTFIIAILLSAGFLFYMSMKYGAGY
jgi:predicted permease